MTHLPYRRVRELRASEETQTRTQAQCTRPNEKHVPVIAMEYMHMKEMTDDTNNPTLATTTAAVKESGQSLP